jgi:predicted metal-dependent enzyme (double-stranded beta helix superfamily)
MTHAVEPAFELLRPRLDAAVAQGGETTALANEIKRVLQSALKGDGLTLPSRFRVALPDTYARRLLHRDPGGRYSVVVMTWGPGQKTGLHDHAGIWCVECVVDGQMDVTQYELISEAEGMFTFTRQSSVRAERGSAGCLIPPFEYHTLGNALPDKPSITLHVYGGEMDQCHVFEPAQGGAYRRVTRALAYHE